MKIFLIRHTRPAIEKGICYGITDLDVADSFPEEASLIRSVLPDLRGKTTIFSSPLQRCYKLADYLAGKQSVQIENRLIEISFGDWELKPWRSFERQTLVDWKKKFVHTPCPNGETFQNVFNRVKQFYEEIHELDSDQVFLVSHSGVIRAFLCLLNGIPLHNAFDDQFGFGVVFQIDQGKVNRIK